MQAFLRERCVVATGQRTEFSDLYEAWQEWCADSGCATATPKQTFGRDLRAAVPGLKNRGAALARRDSTTASDCRLEVAHDDCLYCRTVADCRDGFYVLTRARRRARTPGTHLGVQNVATVRDSAQQPVAAGTWRMPPATRIQTGYLIPSKPLRRRREGFGSAVANPRHWSGDDFMGSTERLGRRVVAMAIGGADV